MFFTPSPSVCNLPVWVGFQRVCKINLRLKVANVYGQVEPLVAVIAGAIECKEGRSEGDGVIKGARPSCHSVKENP